MKKVRYIAGTVGVGAGLGLMMPAGTAVATTPHAPASKGKTVSLPPLRKAPYNFGACGGSLVIFSPIGGLGVTAHVTFESSCISRVSGFRSGKHTDLDMRTRFYKRDGAKVGGDHFDTPHYNSGGRFTSWRHTDTVHAWTVCVALVSPTNHVLKSGAVCVNTTDVGFVGSP